MIVRADVQHRGRAASRLPRFNDIKVYFANLDHLCLPAKQVFDVDIRGYSGGNEDNLIGMLEFDIIKDSVRSMPMEKEFLDWNQLLDRQVSSPPHVFSASTARQWAQF